MEQNGGGGTLESDGVNSSRRPGRVWKSFLDRMNRNHPKDAVEEELARVQSTLSVQTDTNSAASALASPNNQNERGALARPQPRPRPNRLVDFFCVIGPEMLIDRSQATLDLSSTTGPSDILLRSRMVDCYPKSRDGLEFPHHIPTFCFPKACRVSPEPKNPTLFTLVLTSSNGHRLYGSVLTMYDETISLDRFGEIFQASEYSKTLPSWLVHETTNDTSTKIEPSPPKKKQKKRKTEETSVLSSSKQYYLPKCLVIISHHAFFHVYTKFLQQLYRIYQSGAAPLPLERYIANMVHDVPLPPLGRVRVNWNCFTVGSNVQIARPAPNELPMVNYSYQPLFRCLSVANILVLWGVLLQEGRVALCSQHFALLTPVAEALLSLLFPFQWQGMYIPVLPSGMSDVLEAPVPYLVGLDGSELENVTRPAGVVICDLDQDVVHFGYDDDQKYRPRRMPVLPDRDVMRLKVELEEFADPLYLIPPCGIKGRMTTGNGQMLENSAREPYAQMTRLTDDSKRHSTHRAFILSNAERAFVLGGGEPLKPDDFLTTGEQEQLIQTASELSPPKRSITSRRDSGQDSVMSSLKRQQRSIQAHADRMLSFAGQTYATPSPYVVIEADKKLKQKRLSIAAQFYELDKDSEDSSDGYSANSVRHTFLRFFTSILLRYKDFCMADGSLQEDAFLNSLNLSVRNRQCVADIVKTQMFERFLHESSTRRRLFDEHVILKHNQSIWGSAKKQPTPFLDETSKWKIQQVITPAAPSTVGMRDGRVYSYKTFPKLNEEECISSEAVTPWTALCHGTLCSAFLGFS